MRIAIIGAGASGLAAALQAAWNGGDATLFERNPAVGRKLLVTGSGRCNITNQGVAAGRYACADPSWMADLLNTFGLADLLAMLDRMGIPLRHTDDGWYYPLSDSAQTVVDVFQHHILTAGVDLRAATRAAAFHKEGDGFLVDFVSPQGRGRETFDRLVVSAGGKAYPSLGSRGELFPELATLGHTVLEKRPALAPVLLDLGDFKALRGVRFDAGVHLRGAQGRLASTCGNMIFTEWGLNGPAVMDLSHHISARPGEKLELEIDFLAFFEDEFQNRSDQARVGPLPLKVFLEGFFPPKAAAFFCRRCRVEEDRPLKSVDGGDWKRLEETLRSTTLEVRGVRGFEYAQAGAGGVPVGEVDPRSMQSKIVIGLYLTGETLDVVGPCGGYNLQFAFSSGALAGIAAAKM
jgi:predicted Rossmann fold flavoprotein